MLLLKQSTADNMMILLVASSDHITGLASATLTITASKDGGAFASITPTVTDRGSGWYSLALTTSHTDTLGALALHITAASADPTDVVADVVLDIPGASVSSVTGNVAGNVTGTIGDLTTTAKASVKTQVTDALGVDTLTELSQAAPSATPTIKAALMLLYMALRNDLKSTATSLTISNDAGTVICKATLSDDGTTFERAELVSGP